MTSPYAPYVLGHTWPILVTTTSIRVRKNEVTPKSDCCQDRSLKFDFLNAECIVIVSQNLAVNEPLSFTHTARHIS